MGTEDGFLDKIAAFPWALFGFLALSVYAIFERIAGGLKPSEFVDAISAAALLAIGHGIHHGAHVVARAQRERRPQPAKRAAE
jgi:hypothetical protein